jgi:hypothetical protein
MAKKKAQNESQPPAPALPKRWRTEFNTPSLTQGAATPSGVGARVFWGPVVSLVPHSTTGYRL